MKRRDIEGPIMRSIIDYLRLTLKGVVTHHSANEIPLQGKHVARAIAKAKWNGMCVGFPDLIVMWQGKTLLLEVKGPKGVLSPAQKTVRANLEAQNIPYAVVRSIEDTQDALQVWGMV